MGGEIVSSMQLHFRAKSQQSLANIIDEISDFLCYRSASWLMKRNMCIDT